MAKRGRKAGTRADSGADLPPVGDYRHLGAKRKNNPPAKIAAEGTVPAIPKAKYAYNPHLPPVLRFDPTGGPDALPELLAKARVSPLSEAEARLLAEALRRYEPWLEWTGKRERKDFEVDPVALHIHERVSTQAILKIAARQDVQRSLFADPEQDYHEAVQFYRHDVDWANRLVLGDSLQVMSSLARREDLAGKVQMIYMDPPYGIKFASNFQPEVGRRDVKDKEQDLTREPEMVRAYRDTWHLGIHSYLSYLRDRLIVARELLDDTGSVFVQISDENLHRVRDLLDEVMGPTNFIAQIAFATTTGFNTLLLASIADHLLWYGKDITKTKFKPIYREKVPGEEGAAKYKPLEMVSPELAFAYSDKQLATSDQITSQGATATVAKLSLNGQIFEPPSGMHFKTNIMGLSRLAKANRLKVEGALPRYMRLLSDFAVFPITNVWLDIGGVQSRTEGKVYVVQTAVEAIQRCMLMTTDPGDLVLDPTCGSGTTAYVAEQWGRRWITIDTSRVAVAIARQRLLTAKYDYYRLRPTTADDTTRNPNGTWLRDPNDPKREPRTFACKMVPHITLKSIAQNVALDPIFDKHEPVLDKALADCNAALGKVTPEIRARVAGKLVRKEREEGKRAVTDADRRRWELPGSQGRFEHWTVPFDTDPDWPTELQAAVTEYRRAWRAKMDEVNACIAASAEHEELVDQPDIVRNVVRVSGPFTVEAVQPPEMSLGDNVDPHTGEEGLFDGAPGELPEGFTTRSLRIVEPRPELEARNVSAYLDQMFRYLRADGVRFLNNRQMRWTRFEPLFESGRAEVFHAEGRWAADGGDDADPEGPNNVAVVFGPQYGPVTAMMVEESIRAANRKGYEHLLVAGFSFDGAATGVLSEADEDGGVFHGRSGHRLHVHFAHVRPDINPGMNGLLKESPQPGAGQLFSVFGLPRIRVEKVSGADGQGEYTVTMEGVDVYNPVENSIVSTGASKVAAWFLDGDFDGRTFCITQAFFPDRSAWAKLAKALNGKDGPIDAERFEAFGGTTSLPFPAGKHRCVAVKVIDPRGNEVMSVEKL